MRVVGDLDRGLARRAMAELSVSGRLERVATGLDTTYRVRCANGDSLALRIGGVLPIRRPSAMVTEAAWIASLRGEPHFRVPGVLAWPDRSSVLSLIDDDDRHRGIMAVDWLPGQRRRHRFHLHHARALGAAAAGLHHQAAGFSLPAGGWIKTWDADLMAGTGDLKALTVVAGSGAALLVRRVQDQLARATSDLGRSGYGMINADLGLHNAVWDRAVPGLVDFNDSGLGYFAFDLVRFLHYLAERDDGAALVQAALAGYQALAPLPVGYHEYRRLFGAAADLFLARYLAPQVAWLGPGVSDRVVRLVRAADEAAGRPNLAR